MLERCAIVWTRSTDYLVHVVKTLVIRSEGKTTEETAGKSIRQYFALLYIQDFKRSRALSSLLDFVDQEPAVQ